MTDLSKSRSSEADGVGMRDPHDKEIHSTSGRAPYPSAPKGSREMYTDGGDSEDVDGRIETESGAFQGVYDKDLKQLSETEYKEWKKGRTQNQ